MQKAPIPANEATRIASVHALNILDTPPEERFDRITKTATSVFHAPISTITIIDTSREWYKSCQGVDSQEKDRAISFCGHALLSEGVMIIPDTLKDERFRDNPMVISAPNIRFYAGVPLYAADGSRVGVFCIKDVQPRTPTDEDIEILMNFAKWAELEINSEMLSVALQERTRLEKNLLEEKKKLAEEKAKDEAILHNIGDGLVVLDTSRHVIMANKVVTEATGYSNDELMGQIWPDCVTPVNDHNRSSSVESEMITRALKQKEGSSTPIYHPYYYTGKDGKVFPVAATVSPIHMSEDIIGVAIIIRDVAREIAIDKAKSEFVSLASHQLRTPLSTINWYTELLLNQNAGSLNDEQRTFLLEICKGNQRMTNLVSALLNVSRIEMGTFSVDPIKLNLRQLLHDLVVLLDPFIKSHHARIKESYPDSLPDIMLDQQLMAIILQNIITNAIKYSPDQSTIDISVSIQDQDVIIAIADQGIGIPEKQKNKIFTKLFRADNARDVEADGTGLGLYIVKSILDHTGGSIWFESKVNKGTTFYIKLPIKGMQTIKGVTSLNSSLFS
ncbi:PAS domain S-box protein [candidate division WWE3 bacterium]|nr:PAS domain S-box protein [candidate division WWE3 bacterium]